MVGQEQLYPLQHHRPADSFLHASADLGELTDLGNEQIAAAHLALTLETAKLTGATKVLTAVTCGLVLMTVALAVVTGVLAFQH